MTAEFDIESWTFAVHKFLFTLCGDFHIAEELTQETIVKACENRDHVRDMEYPKAWLFKVATNLWRDRLRKTNRAPDTVDQTESLASKTHTPATTLEIKEEYEQVLNHFQQLPPMQRQVLFLRTVEELRIDEIATILETNRNNVKTHLSLARKTMRKKFASPSEEKNEE